MDKNAALSKLQITSFKGEEHVNPLTLAVSHEFSAKGKDCFGKEETDHRHRAINRCVSNEVDFTSEVNTAFDLMKHHIRVKCPNCTEMLSTNDGGSNFVMQSATYKCSGCKIKVTVTIPVDGISFVFE